MRAAWYEQQGAADEVLVVGDMPDPHPAAGEVRIRVAVAGVNPGETKKRSDAFGIGMPYPRVIPHSDGAGIIDEVGDGVPSTRVGERVWCFGAQSYRPFGTAAKYVVVPTDQAIRLPDGIGFEQGACLGIAGLTAHRAVHVGGPVDGRTVLVQGGAGAVGSCAVGLARHAGSFVIATVRSEPDEHLARRAGAHVVIRTDDVSTAEIVEHIQSEAPDGIDHIVEVAFSANIEANAELLVLNGSVAAYATVDGSPEIPFWPLVFKNIRLFFLGSDDFPMKAKQAAAVGLNDALEHEWPGFTIGAKFALSEIAQAHAWIDGRHGAGRVVIDIAENL